MPVEHTCEGADRAPTVTWTGNTEERPLALVVRDADADGIVHWVVTDFDADAGTIDGSPSSPGTVRPNGFGVAAWTGPCPPDDLDHRYVFTLYELDDPLVATPDSEATALVNDLERLHTSAATTLATYTRA
jgi:Raf kinase inhibitor-like YbhB/YbcL family protein